MMRLRPEFYNKFTEERWSVFYKARIHKHVSSF
jgi:hypothetical protein